MEERPTETAPAPGGEPSPGQGGPEIAAWKPGDRIGRYQVIAPLAAGGMGMVFAARLVGAHGVERLVAVKTLRPITSRSDRAALLREARVTSQLHHRNVVATLDLGEIDDVPYVVMELVDGVSLSRFNAVLAERPGEIPPELAAFVVLQAANGLHAAHELRAPNGEPLGLVHRDVSPQNILVSTTGEVKIADFGIAKFEGHEGSTGTGMIKGKFAYMAPEQADAREVDRRCDVFALGIVLWELLTGQRLFQAPTPAQTILKVTQLEPRAASSVRPAVGEDLSAIAQKCLAKSPDARYATAADLASALRGALRARSPVDETDLARVVERWFGKERREVMTVLTTSADGTTLPMGELSVGATTGPIPALRRAPLFGGMAALFTVLAITSGVALWRSRSANAPRPPVAETPSAPVAAAETTVSVATTVSATPPPAEVTVPAPVSAAASQARPPAAKPRGRPPAPARSGAGEPAMFPTL